jgi:hypothetical protein
MDNPDDKDAELKEKMYENYDSNASKRGKGDGEGGFTSTKPKFSLNMAKVTGQTPSHAAAQSLTGLDGGAMASITPSNNLLNKPGYRNIA